MTEKPVNVRRHRAKRVMDALTVLCVAVVMGIGTSQVVSEGWQEFLNRPAGVGASPSEPQVAAPVTAPPEIAQVIPTPASPTSRPIEQNFRPRHQGSERPDQVATGDAHHAQYR
jgi:hypothetical protein